MTSKTLIFAGIIAAITMGNAYATGENTVTSKSYVDARDELKQDKITAKTTGNVVTYNGTENGQTQFDEVGIYNGGAQYNSSTDSGKLITAGTVVDMAAAIESITIADNKLTCYNQNDGCTLWQISEGTTALTARGTFAPLTRGGPPLDDPMCVPYGVEVSNASECCSGILQVSVLSGIPTRCGCNTIDDCPSGGNFTSCDSEKHTCKK